MTTHRIDAASAHATQRTTMPAPQPTQTRHTPATASAQHAKLQADAARALHTSAMSTLHRVPDSVPLPVMDRVGAAMDAAHHSGMAAGQQAGRSQGLRTGLLAGLVVGVMLGMLAMAAAVELGVMYGNLG